MRRLAISAVAKRGGLLGTVVVWTVCLAGCCCGVVPSARFAAPGPVPATMPGAGWAAAARTCPTALPDSGCVVPPGGFCGADDCPSLLAWPCGVLKRCGGPLFHPGRASGTSGEETEAELYPPHSRFHPVPAAPVFAQRYDYEPPDRMMVPTPAHPRLAPQALPHVPGVQPLPAGSGAAGPVADPVPVEPPVGNLLPQPLPAPPQEEKSVLLLRR